MLVLRGRVAPLLISLIGSFSRAKKISGDTYRETGNSSHEGRSKRSAVNHRIGDRNTNSAGNGQQQLIEPAQTMNKGKPTNTMPRYDVGTPSTTKKKSPHSKSDAMPASELPNAANVTAGILASGANNTDFVGNGLIFIQPAVYLMHLP